MRQFTGLPLAWAVTWLLSLWLLAGCADVDGAHDEAVDPSVLAGIQAQLAAREYHASENGEGLQAPNRAHNLRTYFAPDGIRVVDRTAGGSPELLQLSLTGVGRGEELRAVPADLARGRRASRDPATRAVRTS